MPAALTFARNSRISSFGMIRPRHWLAFFANTCSASQRWTTARSTARGRPPATDMCAPRRATALLPEPFGHQRSGGVEPNGGRERLNPARRRVVEHRAADKPHIRESDRGCAGGIACGARSGKAGKTEEYLAEIGRSRAAHVVAPDVRIANR